MIHKGSFFQTYYTVFLYSNNVGCSLFDYVTPWYKIKTYSILTPRHKQTSSWEYTYLLKLIDLSVRCTRKIDGHLPACMFVWISLYYRQPSVYKYMEPLNYNTILMLNNWAKFLYQTFKLSFYIKHLSFTYIKWLKVILYLTAHKHSWKLRPHNIYCGFYVFS